MMLKTARTLRHHSLNTTRPHPYGSEQAEQMRPDISLAIGATLTALLIVASIAGPHLWPIDPLAMDFSAVMMPPSFAHPMGTDANGRDVLARVLSGGALSLLCGSTVVMLGLTVGGALGVIAGLSYGVLDEVIMRTVDALSAFPPLILAIAVTVGFGAGATTATAGIALSCLPFFIRLMRGEIRRIHTQPFIEASHAIGVGAIDMVLRHYLPHTVPTMLVQTASVFGYAILTLAGLGFIGLGVQIPDAEWGAMITDGLQYALNGQWWLAVFPGLAVMLSVFSVNLLADHAQLRMDPKRQ